MPTIEQYRADAEAGLSYNECAKKRGVTPATVRNAACRNGVKFKDTRFGPTSEATKALQSTAAKKRRWKQSGKQGMTRLSALQSDYCLDEFDA